MNMRTYYRHRDGLFPHFRDSFDNVPVPFFISIDDNRDVLRIGVDGVKYIPAGWEDCYTQTMLNHVFHGTWVEFDPLSVDDWAQIIVGELGKPQVVTMMGPRDLPDGYATAWPAAGQARQRMLELVNVN